MRALSVTAFGLLAAVTAAAAQSNPARPTPKAAQCAAPAAAGQLTVAVKAGASRVGEPVTVSWSLPPFAKDPAKPAYLMVVVPDAVRVDGEGFYALAAGSPNPKGVRFAADRTRLVTPLHTRFSDTSGEMQILPYAAGPLAIEWAVVGLAGCEWTASRGKSETLAITAGAPQIVLRDEFSAQRPDQIIRALKGPYKIHVFKDRFEVLEDVSGALVLRREGSEPAFSPTGRFLTLKTSIGETYEAIDLLAGRVLGRYEANELHWSHGDSFFWYEDEHVSKMQIVRALHGRRDDLTARVPTRREAKYAKLLAGLIANMEEEAEDRRPRPPTVDIEPEGTTCARGCYAREHWRINLSLEHGMVTFQDVSPHHENIPPQILVYDLGARHENALFANTPQGKAAYKAAFGVNYPAMRGWDIGDRLQTVMIAYPDDADKKRLAVTGRLINPATVPTTKPDAVVAAAHAAITRDPTDPRTVASKGIIGAKLDHLPTVSPAALRAGRDDAALVQVERELAKLYPPAKARFVPVPEVVNRYERPPLPDPNEAPGKEPVLLSLAAPGRDLWQWSAGSTAFWLTQGSDSSHLQHSFSWSILTRDAAGTMRHLNLIKAANDPDNKSAFKPSGEPDVNEWQLRNGLANIVPDGPYDQTSNGDFRTDLEASFADPSVVAVSGGRYLAVLTKPVTRLIVFDLQTWRFICGNPNPIDGIDAVALAVHANAGHVTQVNADGAVHVYACASGKNVLNGAYVDDELVVMDRNGYFDGSEDATGYVDVTVPGLPGRHLLSQFAKVLWKPNVAAEVLAGRDVQPPAITAPPALRASTQGNALRLEAFSAEGLVRISLYADGRLHKQADVTGTSGSLSVTAQERAAMGTITAIALDKSGLISAPLTIPRPAGARRPAGRLFMLAVGINEYPQMKSCGNGGVEPCNLSYAVSDAKRVAAAAGKSRLYARIDSKVLADAQASKAAILAELERIVAVAAPEDTVVVSFAGHGLDDNNTLQLALSTTRLDQVEATSLGFDAIAGRLRQSRARVVVLLDVCHAGVVDRAAGTNDAAVSQLVTDSGASMVVLSASKGRQFSEETPKAAGGLFSAAFDRVLTSERAASDLDGNGAISINELYRGLKSSVVRASEGRQTPWLSRNRMVGDFDLF
jgi:hypothetical protein